MKKKQNFKLEPMPIIADPENLKKQQKKPYQSIQILEKPLKTYKLPSIPDPRVSNIYLKPLKSEVFASSNSKIQKTLEKKLKKLKSLKKQRKSDLSSYNVSDLKSKIIKVTYQEASKYYDWALIAKPEIEGMWRNLIYLSNGILPIQERVVYKYYIGKGNNSELIKDLMASRKWWTETLIFSEANFIWTQWKENQIFKFLPEADKVAYEFDVNCICSLNYQVPVKICENYRQVDISDLGLQKIKNSYSFTALKTQYFLPSEMKIYNKLEFNQYLSNKKGLLKCMKKYYTLIGQDIFSVHPLTFHVKNKQDPEFEKFLEFFNDLEKKRMKNKLKNVWIVKPGENSNRGQGIKVCKSLDDIQEALRENIPNSKTYILQKYIEKPFLVHSRKFDIRCYALITCINGLLQGYFYSDGYLRTSSVEYNLSNTENSFIHLTNDAVQQNSQDYGRFEDNNKMTYKEFQRYLDFNFFEKKINFFENVLPKIKSIVKDSISATFAKLDSRKRFNCMEIFGYDFMLDYKLTPWIIEANTNPCLELASGYLKELIPKMVDNAFRIVLDCCFPQNSIGKKTFEPIVENRFELIFHELTDGVKVKNLSQF